MKTSARVLISTMQAPGHVNQALAVATRLRERGHRVWFHARPEYAESVAAAGVTETTHVRPSAAGVAA